MHLQLPLTLVGVNTNLFLQLQPPLTIVVSKLGSRVDKHWKQIPLPVIKADTVESQIQVFKEALQIKLL